MISGKANPPPMNTMNLRRILLFLFRLTLITAGTLRSQESPSGKATHQPLRLVLIGDSTVCDYPPSHPNRGWGQFLGERFRDGSVLVINLAASGRSTKTFLSEGRWQKALEQKPDILLIQFGHNDSHAPEKPEATDPATDYKENLRRYVSEARSIGALPVLVTPMVRRTFDAGGKIDAFRPAGDHPPESGRDLASYAVAMKEIGAEQNVFVIDLYSSSKVLAEQLGPSASEAFASKKGDITHFNGKGARAMADLVMEQLPSADSRIKAALKTP